jgi:hypothetical protein
VLFVHEMFLNCSSPSYMRGSLSLLAYDDAIAKRYQYVIANDLH